MSVQLIAASFCVLFLREANREGNSAWDMAFFGIGGLMFLVWSFKELFV